MKNFIKRAQARFPYDVFVNAGFSGNELEEMFGPDAMPTLAADGDRAGRWTVADRSDRGWQFFFLTANDAVEFKLRFG